MRWRYDARIQGAFVQGSTTYLYGSRELEQKAFRRLNTRNTSAPADRDSSRHTDKFEEQAQG